MEGKIAWPGWMEAFTETYQSGISELRLKRSDLTNEISGTVTIK